jgi:LCP family protein required for cell wall assembly
MGLPKKRKKNRNKKIAVTLALIAILIVCLVCVIAYWELTQRQHSASSQVNADQSTLTSENEFSGGTTYEGKTYTYNDHLSNYIFMGIDNRESSGTDVGKTDAGQADALFLMSWDRVEKTVTIISIPRDTMTEIETFAPSGKSLGLSTNHINIAYGFGDGRTKSCELVKDAVSRLFYDIPIQGYCSINLDGIPILTETVGGVTVTVPDDSLEEVYPEFQEGSEVLLTGDNVEPFVRYRDTTQNFSALVRQQRQNVFLKAFAQKASEVFAQDASIVTTLYTKLADYMVTNIGNDVFLKIAEDVSSTDASATLTVPGEAVAGSHYDEYHVDEDALYEMVLDNFYKES